MKLNKDGQSTIMIAVFLGAFVALICADLVTKLQAAYRVENNLRMRNNGWQYAIQIGEQIGRAYELGQLEKNRNGNNGSLNCSGQVCTGTGLSDGTTVGAPSIFRVITIQPTTGLPNTYDLLFPMVNGGVSSFCVENFCLALNNQLPTITALNNREFHEAPEEFHSRYSHGILSPFPLIANAEAGAPILPNPYLSPLPPFPTNTISVSSCTSAATAVASSDCVVCSDGTAAAPNANCVKVRICTDGTTTCSTTASGTSQPYIEPRFAFMTNG